jgi:hypothetical protein
VECELIDVHGRSHLFIEKTAIVTAATFDMATAYPFPGDVACVIVDRRSDDSGREIIVIDTDKPCGVESTEGITRFEVAPSALIEWEFGSYVEKPWDGTL